MKIFIPRILLNHFVSRALTSNIEECGLMVGYIKDQWYVVTSLFVGINLENSPVKFSIDPKTIISAHEYADRYGFEVISVIHSHPAQPKPSSSDVVGMRQWSIPWVIVDSRSGDFDVWIYRGDDVYPVEYNIF